MASLIVRVDSIINIYDQFNVTPVPHAIRRETNQLDLPIYMTILVYAQASIKPIRENVDRPESYFMSCHDI